MSISATSSTNPALNSLAGFGASAATPGAAGAKAKAGKAAAAGGMKLKKFTRWQLGETSGEKPAS